MKLFNLTGFTKFGIFLLILLNISCITCSYTSSGYDGRMINKYSFAFIRATGEKPALCHPLDTKCLETPVVYTGSGVVLYKDIDNKSTFVATAKHICKSELTVEGSPIVFQIKDFDGNKYFGAPVFLHKTQDFCIIKIVDDKNILQPAIISSNPPVYGERVYVMSAPKGIYDINMVPIFEGLYSGNSSDAITEHSIFTVPATFGSSGSPVFNSKGELVGIIHSVIEKFFHISLTVPWSTLDQINPDIYDN